MSAEHQEDQATAREGKDPEALIEEATDQVRVRAQELDELEGSAEGVEPIGLSHLMDVPVQVTVEVGRTRMPLARLVQVGPGSLISLDREAHEPVDVLVNGKVVARGDVVTLDGSYGVRITSVHQER